MAPECSGGAAVDSRGSRSTTGLPATRSRIFFVAQGALHVVTADVRGLVLNRLDGGRFRAAASPFTLDWFHNRMNQLAAYDRQGNWWLATPEGFMRSTARSHERVPEEPMRRYGRKEGLWTEEGYKVFVDSAGDVWMGSSGGFHNLSRWRKSTETIERHQVKTVPSGSKYWYGSVRTHLPKPRMAWCGSDRAEAEWPG